MTSYVYIIAGHDESGIEAPWFATLDRGRVVSLFKRRFPKYVAPYSDPGGWAGHYRADGLVDAVLNLEGLLAKGDEDLSRAEDRAWGHSFMPGWGAPKLYVLKIE